MKKVAAFRFFSIIIISILMLNMIMPIIDPSSFNVIAAPARPPTTAPSHISPSNAARDVSLTPTFSWGAVSGATRYGLFISDTTTGALVYDTDVWGVNITGTSFVLPSGILRQGVTYRWNMRAGNAAGWSNIFSTAWTFTTAGATVTVPQSSLPENPVILGITPNPVRGANVRQWLTISGSGFSREFNVTLTTKGYPFIIPRERTKWINSEKVKIYINTTSETASWSAVISNPNRQNSNSFVFEVRSSEELPPIRRVTFNGMPLEVLEYQVITERGRTLVPVRVISEKLGQIKWNNLNRSITITHDDIIVYMRINNNTALVNAQEVLLDVPPRLHNNIAYVPVRFLADVLGLHIVWDPIGLVALNEINNLQQTIEMFRRYWIDEFDMLEPPGTLNLIVNFFAPGFVSQADSLYFAGLDMYILALRSLTLAEMALRDNNIELSKKKLNQAVRFRTYGSSSINTAFKVFPSAIEASVRQILTLPITLPAGLISVYVGAKMSVPAATIYAIGWSLLESKVDYSIDVAARGENIDEAKRKAIINAASSVFFEIPSVKAEMEVLINEPVRRFVGRDSGIYQIIERHLRVPEIRTKVMKRVSKVAESLTSDLVKSEVKDFISLFTKTFTNVITQIGN